MVPGTSGQLPIWQVTKLVPHMEVTGSTGYPVRLFTPQAYGLPNEASYIFVVNRTAFKTRPLVPTQGAGWVEWLDLKPALLAKI